MVVKPYLRLFALDLALLRNVGMKAVRTAGFPRSIPLILTGIIILLFVIISTVFRIVRPPRTIKKLGSVQPWMIKYQFIFAYRKKTLDNPRP